MCFGSEAIYSKIRNARIRRAAYAASKRLDAVYLARVLVQIVYKSDRLHALLERRATIDSFEDDAKRFKLNFVARPDEAQRQRIAKYPTLRLMSGSELRLETLVASTSYSFRDVYRCARACLGLKPNADSRSLRLTYIGNRLPQTEWKWIWKYGEEIPCNDILAYRRLFGVIMQAIIHK